MHLPNKFLPKINAPILNNNPCIDKASMGVNFLPKGLSVFIIAAVLEIAIGRKGEGDDED